MSLDLHGKHPLTPNVTPLVQIFQSSFSGEIIFLLQGEKSGE